jgi:hypothetical protein
MVRSRTDLSDGVDDLLRRALLLPGSGDRSLDQLGGVVHQLSDLLHLTRAVVGRQDRRRRLSLDRLHDLTDRVGRLQGAAGKLPDLGCNDGEALAALAGAGSLDRGVESEQVRLRGQLVDQHEDPGNLL